MALSDPHARPAWPGDPATVALRQAVARQRRKLERRSYFWRRAGLIAAQAATSILCVAAAITLFAFLSDYGAR